jgi:hypothetical protein
MNCKCHYCICPHCNKRRCRQSTELKRCLFCSHNLNVPTVDCSRFESRYRHKVYRVVSKRHGGDRILTKLNEILSRLS